MQVMQEPLASLVEDKSPGNLVRQLRNMLNNPGLPKEQNRAIRDFLKFLLGLAMRDTMEVGEQTVFWKQGALASGNAVHEHCLEVYLAWLLSSDDPAEIYSENKDWIRIYTVGRGEYIVTEHDSGELIDTWTSPEETMDVMAPVLPGIKLSKEFDRYDFYYVWDDETYEQVLNLPCDRDYDVWFISGTDQSLPVTAAWFPSFLEKDVYFHEQTLQAGAGETVFVLNSGELTRSLAGGGENGKSSVSPNEETELLQFEEGKSLGSRIVFAGFAAAVFVLCLLILLLWLLVRGIRKRKRRRAA